MGDNVKWLNHEFIIYPPGTQWNNVAGIYIFAGLNPQNQWAPYYIGQCDSFQNRIPSHALWGRAQSLGATHVHAKVVPQALDRDLIEKELVQAFQPPLNTQLR
jgi:hypothetical protein